MEYIKLKERKDILKLGLQDEEGNIIKDQNGNEVYLEFDLGDIELPLKYNRCVSEVSNAQKNLKCKLIIINKKQDHKIKGFLTSNEKEKLEAMKQFYKEMETAIDLFLGKGGTAKFLNGKSMYWEIWDDINEMIKPYLGKMQLTIDGMAERIKKKYKTTESDVLTND